MAILAPIFAFLGRFVTKLLNMVFGWASILLFGRVPQSKQILLSGVSLGAILWIAVLLGVAFPDVGTFLIGFVPAPDWISDGWIRLAMLVLAVVLPIAVGVGGLFLLDPEDRPTGKDRIVQVLRGYPYSAVLALVLVVMIVVAPVRKIRTIIKRWDDDHIPFIIRPNGYERVANDVESALDGAGLGIERGKAPWILEAPSKLLAVVGGGSVRRLVPDRLFVLQNAHLEVTLHPADLAITGEKDFLARARAAIASRLAFTEAYLTTAKESQEIEDALREIAEGIRTPDAFAEIDRRLAELVVPHDEWEVLYRQRLQVERDLWVDQARQKEESGPVASVGKVIRRIAS